ncbi:MAG TPA: TrkA family potassium uptake protein [Anaerolineaceae bacterium]|nr:TrkA family potassium uptake protein [Anaerolineaceae bacterium]HPN51707.1 TrkA family potassium uptake protein [Anaerolineaceae bacterium]
MSQPPWIRKFKASWRDTLILLSEFKSPLIAFLFLILIAGWLYFYLSTFSSEPIISPVEGAYQALSLIFLQSIESFPPEWYLQIFFFILPLIGLSILAQGLTEFGILFFNRKARGKDWEMAVASTFNNHVILVGLGHLGYRVARQLHEMDHNLVVIDLHPDRDLINQLHQLDIPVIEDDASREIILDSASIRNARAILLCTQNDSLNLQIAVKARKMNPKIEVIVRIFDDDFATSLQQQFGFKALSATGMAAPIFAATAAGVDITPPINIEGQANSLARLQINPKSRLVGKTIGQVETIYDLSLVLLTRSSKVDTHPAPDRVIQKGDIIAILGSPEHINLLVHDN